MSNLSNNTNIKWSCNTLQHYPTTRIEWSKSQRNSMMKSSILTDNINITSCRIIKWNSTVAETGPKPESESSSKQSQISVTPYHFLANSYWQKQDHSVDATVKNAREGSLTLPARRPQTECQPGESHGFLSSAQNQAWLTRQHTVLPRQVPWAFYFLRFARRLAVPLVESSHLLPATPPTSPPLLPCLACNQVFLSLLPRLTGLHERSPSVGERNPGFEQKIVPHLLCSVLFVLSSLLRPSFHWCRGLPSSQLNSVVGSFFKRD